MRPWKICAVCGEYKEHHARGMCHRCYNKKLRVERPWKVCIICGEYRGIHAKGKCKSCYNKEHHERPINPESSTYLGCTIAEKVLSKVFNNVETMPYRNPGFDFICNKGKKIDVKSSCIDNSNKLKCRWAFGIRKNKIADFFLCIAFDNRDKLTPLHLWLIPSDKINNLTKLSISNRTLKKWSEYEMDITDTLRCCDTIKT